MSSRITIQKFVERNSREFSLADVNRAYVELCKDLSNEIAGFDPDKTRVLPNDIMTDLMRKLQNQLQE